MTRRKKRWLWLAMVPVLVAVVAFAAKGRSSSDKDEEKGPEVPTLAAKMGDVQVVVREVGTVEPEVKVDVKSNLSGRVVDLKIKAGDRVHKGQLLACIEPDVNQARDLVSVQGSVKTAGIALKNARSDYQAKRELFEKGLVSVEVNRNAETAYRQAQQTYDEARRKIQVVEASGIPVGENPRQVVNITSPMDGVVIDRPVELGETVTGSGSFNAGTVMATVADLGSMLVKAGINEVDIGKIHNGQPVRVTLDAFPRLVFPGTIRRIAPAARLDNQVKVFDVEIDLDRLGKELRTGMTANIEIRGEERKDVLIVPVESVFLRGDDEVVYLKRNKPLPKKAPEAEKAPEGEKAKNGDDWRKDPRQQWRRWFEERHVESGISSTTNVEILKGLAKGDEVALADPTKPPETRS
jgi:HlyD family secretion protein